MPIHNFARPHGKLVEIEVDGKSLAENLLGDPAVRTVAVYLPAGYDESDAEYPLMVDLAAFTSSGLKRLAWTAFGESVPQRVDRLIAQGKMGPTVIAFPDAFTTLGGNQYVNSPVLGRWEQFIVEDLIPKLETSFRLRKGRANRAVYGKSSGGYGALVQGMRYADHWTAVACHSGDMGFEWVYLRDFPSTVNTLARYDGDPHKFLDDVRAIPKLRGDQFHTLMVLAMAASYDPAPDTRSGIRLPVDPHTCELDPTRWQAWLDHDPVRMVDLETHRHNLARLSGLFFDCGRRDQYFLHFGARTLSRKLSQYGIEHTYEEFDDNHSSIDYRLDVSLPYLYAKLTA